MLKNISICKSDARGIVDMEDKKGELPQNFDANPIIMYQFPQHQPTQKHLNGSAKV